jgi:MYXO-CTERM domain-containing protein
MKALRRRTLFCTAAAALAMASSQALAAGPGGSFDTWTCVGLCGTSPADGDIVLSPLANPAYGYVATAGSTAYGASPLVLDGNSRGVETNGSRVTSAAFHAVAGEQIDVQFNYVSTDGKGFDDYAWARLVNVADNSTLAWLFTARSSNSATGNIVPGDVLRREDFDPREVIVNYADFAFTSKTADDPIAWTPLGGSNGTCWRDNAAGCGYTGWLQSRHTFAAAGDYRLEVGVVNWGDEAYDSGLAFDVVGLTAAAVPEPAAWQFWALAGLVGGLRWRRRRSR